MTDSAVHYSLDEGLATITFDDGKANVINASVLTDLAAAFDRAEEQARCVVWRGRAGRFCAGFDLKVFAAGGAQASDLLRRGAEFAVRLYSFPSPVVIACTGHALGMGAIYLLAADVRIGAEGPFKIGLPEVTIGMAMPGFGRELAWARLSPTHRDVAVCCAEIFGPQEARRAGFLDRVVAADGFEDELAVSSARLVGLDPSAHYQTKMALRSESLGALRRSLEEPILGSN